MTFSPFLFFLFHFSFSLTLSLTAHSQHPNDPNTEPDHIRNIQTTIATIVYPLPFVTIPSATISPSQRFFADPHSRRSHRRDHRLPIPIRDDLAESFAIAVAVAVHHCRHFCLQSSLLPSSHLLAVITEARCRHWSLIVVADQTPATFRLPPTPTLQLPGPSTSTHTDYSPSLRHFKPQRPFGFHFNRWPFTFPSNFFVFFLTTSSMRLLKLYLFIAFLQSAILHTHTYRNAYISLIVFICLNCCFCKRVRCVCVVFVCGQVLDGVLSYDDGNHFMRMNVYWFGDGEFY